MRKASKNQNLRITPFRIKSHRKIKFFVFLSILWVGFGPFFLENSRSTSLQTSFQNDGKQNKKNSHNSTNDISAPKSSTTAYSVSESTPYGAYTANHDTRTEHDYFTWTITTLSGPGISFYIMNETEFDYFAALTNNDRTPGNFDYSSLLSHEESSSSGTFNFPSTDKWYFVCTNHYTGSDTTCEVEIDFSWMDDSITITSPVQQDSWDVDSTYPITWTSEGDFLEVNISLYYQGEFIQEIASNVENDGSYDWSLSNEMFFFTDHYQINITDAHFSDTWAMSDYFEVFVEEMLIITSPTYNSLWEVGSNHVIRWQSIGDISEIYLDLYENGEYILEIIAPLLNGGEYNWTLPEGLSNSSLYQIRISQMDGNVSGFSPFFEISFYSEFPKITGYPYLFIGALLGIGFPISTYWKRILEPKLHHNT
jgi:hypothetical protein